ncbi:MAG: hypothetical protein JO271_09595 [Verrucomicrobia bacterium]|nr:hypothetical protein [Verrucomicrobiota bacterium]MBV9274828.1 hypothetical protein [Verrucomicrobiota bacterium]
MQVPRLVRLIFVLAAPLTFLLASCDNRTQEARRYDHIFQDLDSKAKVQPWTEAKDVWNDEGRHQTKNWN